MNHSYRGVFVNTWPTHCLGVLLLLVSWSAAAAETVADKATAIDALVQRYAEYNMFNGSILVAESGKVIYAAGHGKANLQWDVENTPQAKYRVGSITKQFTSMLVMQLVQRQELSLHDPLSEHLPDFTAPWASRVTIHHLLSHSSGIPNTIEIPGWLAGRFDQITSKDELITAIAGLRLNFEPGEAMRYSNSGYFLLGVLIESVTGLSYGEALQKSILDPLGMERSGNDHQSFIVPEKASDYTWSPAGGFRVPDEPNLILLEGSGSMYATVGDLYRWDRALYTDRLLDERHKDLLFTPHLKGAAYGWFVGEMSFEGDDVKPRTIRHGGQLNGFNALIVRFIDDQHLVVALHNKGATDLDGLVLEIAAILYAVEPSSSVKLPVNFLLVNAMAEGKITAGVEEYLAQPDLYSIRQAEVNRLGYQLLAVPLYQPAIEVFKLNAAVFPASAEAYDSLAEAYRAAGDPERSIANYRKSLELDAGNEGARRAIEEMIKSDRRP